MLRDLKGWTDATPLEADVLVIGAGIAGLLVATRLAKTGLRVVVTESGAEHQTEETHTLNEVLHLKSVYQGAAHGRFRCLGGTSTRWGGAMLPFLAADLAGDGARTWPLRLTDLEPYQSQVEDLFQLPPGPYDEPDLVRSLDAGALSHKPRLAKWPSFGRRNVARLFNAEIRDPNGPEVWLNATVTALHLDANAHVTSVSAEAPDGSRLTVAAREIVLAAGAIESTRLLLLVDRAHDDRLFAPHNVLGRFFHDHLSVRVGDLQPSDRSTFNRIVGFRFQSGGMRNLRFEPSEDPAVRANVPAGFAHVVLGSRAGSGFDLLRDAYRNLQKRELPSASTVLGLMGALPWLSRAVWWRQWEKRLLFPADANLELHMVIEQLPRSDNVIGLSRTRTDPFGQPLATIEWSVGRDDEANLGAAIASFAAFWSGSSLSQVASLRLRNADEAIAALTEGGGIYHPGGSTRMGRHASDAVVDSDLRCFALPNLRVVSTSTFPSGGGANPTMTLMMFALRAADAIEARLAR